MAPRNHQFEEQIKKFAQLQKDHLTAFETDLLPDLKQHGEERKKAFDKFKTEFQKFAGEIDKQDLETSQETRELIERYMADINALIDQNQVLKDKVTELRGDLRQSMKNITAGKKAINAYGSSSSRANRPRAINLSN